jgi:hypothetical protein
MSFINIDFLAGFLIATALITILMRKGILK